MTDYLALALAQERDGEEESREEVALPMGYDIHYGPQTTQVESGLPRSKNPPLPAPSQERDSAGLSPRLKMPRVGEDFRFSVSRDATRAEPYSAEKETGRRNSNDVLSDEEKAEDGGPENSGGDIWADRFRQGQSPTRRGKNLPLPALSQYETVGSFSAQAWPRGGAIFDSGGSIASVRATAPGDFGSALEQKEWPAREEAVLPLLRQVRQAQRSGGFVQSQRRAFTVTLPEGGSGPALSAEDFDLACERDARRYGGGFGLY